MRRKAGPTEKLYINSNTLSVKGERIDVVSQPSRRVAVTKRHHRIEIESTPSVNELTQEEEDTKTKKQATIKLKECVPLGDDVLSRQVRKIRETVETEDFERLLIGLTGATEIRRNARQRHTINANAVEQIYRRFFGVYYELLHEVVKANSGK